MFLVPLSRMKSMAYRTTLFLTLAALIFCVVLPASAGAAPLPKSCAELSQQNPSATDGEYTLNLQGHSARIYCADMSGTPKEYITLANTGANSNYSFFPGRHVLHAYRFGEVIGTDAWTSYLKVRIDPTTLVVDQNDVTFTNLISVGSNGYDYTNPGFNPTPKTAAYANASDCYNTWSARGRANVDLTGTDFAIDDSVNFVTVGFEPAGGHTIDADRQIVNMTGGGWCGGTGPEGPLKLKLLTPTVDEVPPTATVSYSTTDPTNQDVVATISPSEPVTITNNGGSASYSFTSNGSFTFEFEDAAGNTGTATATVSNIDKTAPTLVVATNMNAITPPNHKLVTISINWAADDDASGIASVRLVSVTSNEPDNGLGDGDTADDIQGADIGTADEEILLRAERAGNGNGRVYTIVYEAMDHAGNKVTALATVSVPHSAKKK